MTVHIRGSTEAPTGTALKESQEQLPRTTGKTPKQNWKQEKKKIMHTGVIRRDLSRTKGKVRSLGNKDCNSSSSLKVQIISKEWRLSPRVGGGPWLVASDESKTPILQP